MAHKITYIKTHHLIVTVLTLTLLVKPPSGFLDPGVNRVNMTTVRTTLLTTLLWNMLGEISGGDKKGLRFNTGIAYTSQLLVSLHGRIYCPRGRKC